MQSLPRPPAGFTLLDPPHSMLVERAPPEEGDRFGLQSARDSGTFGRMADPLSSIDEIQRLAREIADYWATRQAADEPPEPSRGRAAGSLASPRNRPPAALPLLDVRDYRPPDFRPTDYRGDVGDIGFSGLRDDEEPLKFSPEHLAAWDSNIAQMQVAFDKGETRQQLIARARGHKTPIDDQWLSNLDAAIRHRAKGGKVQWVRDPRSFAPPPPDISDVRGGRDERDKALMDVAGKGGPLISALAFLGTEGADAAVRSAANTVTAGLADKFSAAVNTLGGGTYRENLRRERAINDYDSEHHWWAQLGGTAAGAVLLPTRAPQAALGAGRMALRGGLGRAEAIVAAGRAGTRRAALEGGAYGTVHGAVTTDGSVGDRVTGAVLEGGVGTATGGLAGDLGGRLINALPRAGKLRASAFRPKTDPSAPHLTEPPVISLTGKELGVRFRGSRDLPALRQSAQDWYKSNLLSGEVRTMDGRLVRFTNRGLRKSTNKGDILLRSLPAIPEILKRGKLIQSRPGRGLGTKAMHVYAGWVDLGGQRLELGVLVRETNDGHFQYDFTMVTEREGAAGAKTNP